MRRIVVPSFIGLALCVGCLSPKTNQPIAVVSQETDAKPEMKQQPNVPTVQQANKKGAENAGKAYLVEAGMTYGKCHNALETAGAFCEDLAVYYDAGNHYILPNGMIVGLSFSKRPKDCRFGPRPHTEYNKSIVISWINVYDSSEKSDKKGEHYWIVKALTIQGQSVKITPFSKEELKKIPIDDANDLSRLGVSKATGRLVYQGMECDPSEVKKWTKPAHGEKRSKPRNEVLGRKICEWRQTTTRGGDTVRIGFEQIKNGRWRVAEIDRSTNGGSSEVRYEFVGLDAGKKEGS